MLNDEFLDFDDFENLYCSLDDSFSNLGYLNDPLFDLGDLDDLDLVPASFC